MHFSSISSISFKYFETFSLKTLQNVLSLIFNTLGTFMTVFRNFIHCVHAFVLVLFHVACLSLLHILNKLVPANIYFCECWHRYWYSERKKQRDLNESECYWTPLNITFQDNFVWYVMWNKKMHWTLVSPSWL